VVYTYLSDAVAGLDQTLTNRDLISIEYSVFHFTNVWPEKSIDS
jgi:hypothetical protein